MINLETTQTSSFDVLNRFFLFRRFQRRTVDSSLYVAASRLVWMHFVSGGSAGHGEVQ